VYERIISGIQQPRKPVMDRGTREEPRIRCSFVTEHGIKLEPHPGRDVLNSKYRFASVSPDDFCIFRGLDTTVDYKSVSIWAAKKWGTATEAMPDDIAMQVRWAMAITERPRAVVYAAFGEDLRIGENPCAEFAIRWCRTYVLDRDLDFERAMLHVAESFWLNHIEALVPPPADPKPTRRPRSAHE
jgi:hypothetical protein